MGTDVAAKGAVPVVRGALILVVALAASLGTVQAQSQAKDVSDVGLFSVIVIDDNSDAWSAGLKNTFGVKGRKSTFELVTTGYRIESTSRVNFALGPSTSNYDVHEIKMDWEAESYNVGLRFDRLFARRAYWVLGSNWERNRPKGLADRFIQVAGIGARWVDGDKKLFRTDLALTTTRENDVVDDPSMDNQYAGVRFASKFQRTFTTGATLGQELVFDQNLDRTSDKRADLNSWVSFAAGPHLALQAGVQLLYDWEPALQEIPLFVAPLIYSGQNVRIPYKEFDKLFTTSLVVLF